MAMVGDLVFLIVWRALALIEPLALRIAVQKPAAVAALVASLTYLVISGASVSTQRAFIMSAVVFGAVVADLAALSLRSYAIGDDPRRPAAAGKCCDPRFPDIVCGLRCPHCHL